MKQRINIIFLIIITAMLLIPVALTHTAEGAVSDVDERVLIARPSFESKTYTAEMEKWLRDRIGLGDQIKVAYANANDYLFGELTSPHYQYGRDRYTFFKLHNNVEFSDYHMTFVDMVAQMQRYCESRGTKFYYVFNPEKESLYRKMLPAGINYDDTWVDTMLSYMDYKGINYVDLRDVLKSSEEVFNRKNDAGHWNQTGAFIGMREITTHMKKDIPSLSVLDENEYKKTVSTTEKLYGSNQIIKKDVPEYELRVAVEDVTGDMTSELKRHQAHTSIKIARNGSYAASKIKTMLFFEDDLFEQFAFSRARENVSISCLQNAINYDYYYNIFMPDVVVFKNTEYVVNNKYFSEGAMKASKKTIVPAILKNFPSDDFGERKAMLLEKANEFDSTVRVGVTKGQAIDRVVLNKELRSSKYAYLITDSRVIDLKQNESGIYEAYVRRGELDGQGSVTLYIQRQDGSKDYAEIPVTNNIL